MKLEPPDHPALWRPALAMTPDDIATHQQTIVLMKRAIAEIGGAGLAAPQVGLGLRMFVTMYPGFEVCINPSWRQRGTDFISKPEKCLSRLDYSTYVRRPACIDAEWTDDKGDARTAILQSMEARIFMHLCDLCDGKPMFPPLRSSSR